MSNLRSKVRFWASILLAAIIVPIIISVVGEFFIELAREKGYYENPSQTVDSVMTALSAFFTQTWFLLLAAIVSGLTAGLWLDQLLRHREKNTVPVSAELLAEARELMAGASTSAERDQIMALNQVSHKIRSVTQSLKAHLRYVRRVDVPKNYQDIALESEIYSTFLKVKKLGLPCPSFSEDAPRYWVMKQTHHFFESIYPLIRDNEIEAAKEMAEERIREIDRIYPS